MKLSLGLKELVWSWMLQHRSQGSCNQSPLFVVRVLTKVWSSPGHGWYHVKIYLIPLFLIYHRPWKHASAWSVVIIHLVNVNNQLVRLKKIFLCAYYKKDGFMASLNGPRPCWDVQIWTYTLNSETAELLPFWCGIDKNSTRIKKMDLKKL